MPTRRMTTAYARHAVQRSPMPALRSWLPPEKGQRAPTPRIPDMQRVFSSELLGRHVLHGLERCLVPSFLLLALLLSSYTCKCHVLSTGFRECTAFFLLFLLALIVLPRSQHMRVFCGIRERAVGKRAVSGGGQREEGRVRKHTRCMPGRVRPGKDQSAVVITSR